MTPPPIQREYLIRLPLPLAQLYSRAYNAKDARGRHDNAFYLFEVLIKLAASALAAAYLQEVRSGGARVPTIDRVLAALALPSLGQWLAMVRGVSRHFGARPTAGSHPLGGLWDQLSAPHRDLPGVLALYRRIKNGPDGEPGGDVGCSLLQLLESIVQYRNAVFGHGAGRAESFYEEEMGPLLLPAANEVLAEGTLDLLGPKGTRLVRVTNARLVDERHIELTMHELIGREGFPATPRIIDAAAAAELAPNRVGVLWPGHVTPLMLDPLLVHRENDLGEEVLFLNRERTGRQVEYLSYSTGRTERDAEMAPAMARLLTQVTGHQVAEADLSRIREQTFAETASFETLFEAPEQGLQRIGDFDVIAELGRGGMGVVYLARQLSLGRLVALKMLPADLAGDEAALARFRRETRALGRCEHPNIVKILSSGTLPDGQQYYAMEYVPGADLEQVWEELAKTEASTSIRLDRGTLSEAISAASRKARRQVRSRGGPRTGTGAVPSVEAQSALESLPPANPGHPVPTLDTRSDTYVRRVVTLIRDVAHALEVVHDQDFVHRDVKPANLMLTADGSRVVLMDFGLARAREVSMTVTRDAGLLGTLRYAAPEQLASATLKVGKQADIRALGVILWELLSRRRAFGEAADESQLAAWVLSRDLPALRTIDPSLGADLEAIVAKATARDAGERIESATRFAEYLELYLAGKPLPIRPPGIRELARRWINQNRGLFAAMLGALVVVLGTVVLAFALITQSRNEEASARAKAEASERHARRASYAAQMSLAHREYEQGYHERALRLLDAFRDDGGDLRGFEWYLLRQQCDIGQVSLKGHETLVYSVAYSRDGRKLASGDGKGEVILWDLASHKPRTRYFAHNSSIWAIDFSPDGRTLVTGSADGTVKLWDADTGAAHSGEREARHDDCVYGAVFSLDGTTVASGGCDGRVRVWDARDASPRSTLTGHRSAVCTVAYAPDHRTLASSGEDSEVILWDLPSGSRLTSWLTGQEEVENLAFSPDGRQVLTAGIDGTVKLWTVKDPAAPSQVFDGHTKYVASVDFAPDGERFASASADGTARLWSVRSAKALAVLRGHHGMVYWVSFSGDGRALATAGADGLIKLWDPRDGKPLLNAERRGAPPLLQTLQGKNAHVAGVAISLNGERLATGGSGEEREGTPERDGIVEVWDLDTGALVKTLRGHTASVTAVAFSPDGSTLASAAEDGTVRFWSATGLEPLYAPAVNGHPIAALAFSPDGAIFATGDHEGGARLWSTNTRTPLHSLQGHKGKVLGVAFSPNGRWLATGAEDRTIQVWDVASGQLSRTLRGHGDRVRNLVWSSDGRVLASASADRTARLWDVEKGTTLHILEGHYEGLTALAFTDAGLTLVTGSRDGSLRFWDPRIGAQKMMLASESGKPVRALAFTPDTRVLVAAGEEAAVRVWRVNRDAK